MGASIYYQPVSGKHLPMGGRQSFLDFMRRVLGGDYPWLVTDANLLRVAARITDDPEHRAALEEIADAVELHGEVRVWAEY
jgi:hypothetical protein